MFELPVLAGPLLLTALLVVSTPASAVLVGLACSAVGAGLVTASRAAGTVAARDDGSAHQPAAVSAGPVRIAAVRQPVAVIAVQSLAVGVVQVASVARVADQGSGAGAGLLYAALTAGSLLATALAGSRWGPRAPSRTAPLLLLGLAVTTGAAAVAPNPPLLVVCLFGLCAVRSSYAAS